MTTPVTREEANAAAAEIYLDAKLRNETQKAIAQLQPVPGRAA